MAVAIPRGCVATHGEIGRALGIGPGRWAGPFRYLRTPCRRAGLFTAPARRRPAMKEKLERCSKQKGVPFRNGRVDMTRIRAARTH